MAHFAVDLTPILPGGDNGGAKVLAVELLKEFKNLSPKDKFTLLTASWNHNEIGFLDGPNMSRKMLVKGRLPASGNKYFNIFLRMLSLGHKVCDLSQKIIRRKKALHSLGADLLFCPFSTIVHSEQGIPSVVIIYDIQHIDIPENFSRKELIQRNRYMQEIKERADAVICISEFSRQRFLKHFKINNQNIFNVPICIHNRLYKLSHKIFVERQKKIGIFEQKYMFYPANFWPHKNHKSLLQAFKIYKMKCPNSDIKLALTGSLSGGQAEAIKMVKQMRLSDHVLFLGYQKEQDLSAVWQGAQFLIFPSLYEGFGIPLLESMHFGKPVLCSNSTSLPEVAGDAALYFDPNQPKEIADCIEKILKDSNLADKLIKKGQKRVLKFDKKRMALRYLEILHANTKAMAKMR